MKPKPCIFPKPNYLFRTAIEAEILFAVCLNKKQALTGGKSLACEDKYSKKIGAVLVQQADRRSFEASAMPVFVYFYIIMIVHKCQQSAAQSCLGTFELRVLPFGKTSGIKLLNLLSNSTDRTFENRRSRYKELGKKVPQAYRVYVEDTFLPCDAGDARIFSKEETGLYYYGARYLDQKYSRWLSGDPALNDYIPQAPVNDEAKKHNENLPGMGGVFNVVNLHVYHYAGNNPVKYTDPDGKITWNRAEDGDIHYNSLYNPDLRNCYAVFSINTEHYRATRETNTIKNHSYSLSGTKDIIEIRQGGIEAQTITTVTLKRFNINLDGKNYDVFKMEGESNIRLLFISNTKHLKSSFFANDPLGDDKSIYNGFYNLNNFIDFLKGEDANKLAFAAISFGLAFFLNPVEANFTDGLFNHLSSKAEGQVPTTSGIDKDTLDLLSQIIEEYER
ncbi:RHS repeat-associated core domain-containing protein [Treponema sp. OMZ 787]|nr:RHS repeat-associated core domain-containing protein [Treponema sp. OMZ 787]UTC61765.1 RHS repeat-associated core domain-containing protein [Treponema sp. OMZ 787]